VQNLANFGPQSAKLWALTACHGQCQRVHMEGTERESTKLCYMFGSGPDLKMHIKNFRVPPIKRGAQKLSVFGWLMKTCTVSANIDKPEKLPLQMVPYVLWKLVHFGTQTVKSNCMHGAWPCRLQLSCVAISLADASFCLSVYCRYIIAYVECLPIIHVCELELMRFTHLTNYTVWHDVTWHACCQVMLLWLSCHVGSWMRDLSRLRCVW